MALKPEPAPGFYVAHLKIRVGCVERPNILAPISKQALTCGLCHLSKPYKYGSIKSLGLDIIKAQKLCLGCL